MDRASYRWLTLELGAPKNDTDPAVLLINGRPVAAEEFHTALMNADQAVFALTEATGDAT